MSKVFFMLWSQESQQLNPLKSLKLSRTPNLGEYFVTHASSEKFETFKVIQIYDASEAQQYGDLIVVLEQVADHFDLPLIKEVLSNNI